MKFDQRKILKAVEQKGAEIISAGTYPISCPHCKASITVPVGKSVCPVCGKEIDASLNIRTIH